MPTKRAVEAKRRENVRAVSKAQREQAILDAKIIYALTAVSIAMVVWVLAVFGIYYGQNWIFAIVHYAIGWLAGRYTAFLSVLLPIVVAMFGSLAIGAKLAGYSKHCAL